MSILILDFRFYSIVLFCIDIFDGGWWCCNFVRVEVFFFDIFVRALEVGGNREAEVDGDRRALLSHVTNTLLPSFPILIPIPNHTPVKENSVHQVSHQGIYLLYHLISIQVRKYGYDFHE